MTDHSTPPFGGAPHQRGPWSVLSERVIYDNPWIAVSEYQVLNPKGNPGIYGVVHLKNLALGVVPIDDQGRVVLVGQHRFPLDYYSWEIPEGGGPLDVDPSVSAARELAEETGLVATHMVEILQPVLSNSVTDERAYLYLAWGLAQGVAQPDDTEDLALRRVPFKDALAMALSGEINDAMSVMALMRVALMKATGTLPKGFDSRLLD
jgi:8-oxo-dGTP pyrophosphatase MutT (NUDIX family)